MQNTKSSTHNAPARPSTGPHCLNPSKLCCRYISTAQNSFDSGISCCHYLSCNIEWISYSLLGLENIIGRPDKLKRVNLGRFYSLFLFSSSIIFSWVLYYNTNVSFYLTWIDEFTARFNHYLKVKKMKKERHEAGICLLATYSTSRRLPVFILDHQGLSSNSNQYARTRNLNLREREAWSKFHDEGREKQS